MNFQALSSKTCNELVFVGKFLANIQPISPNIYLNFHCFAWLSEIGIQSEDFSLPMIFQSENILYFNVIFGRISEK